MAEKEYIERDLILTKNMCGNANPITYRTYAEELIRSIPAADVVEIVRCKDCKHFLFDTEYCKEHNRGYCEFDNTIKTRNHFCSYGERKNNG